jgi:signal transduction histidine kinase
MGNRVTLSGLVVAGIGFFVTRFTVTLTLYTDDPTRFYVAGVVPLAIGLGLAAFGVALAVADVDPAVVRTTALWCVLGTAAMFVFAILTLVGSAGGPMAISSPFFRSYLSNFLIGGSVGGTLTGLYAARNSQQRRQLRQHSNRLVVLNRMLRHEVLNALTAIRGFTSIDGDLSGRAGDVVRDRSSAIERTIEDVKHLTHEAGDRTARTVPVDLDRRLEAAVDSITDRYPGVSVSIDSTTDGLTVSADEQLVEVFTLLLENAVVHGGDERPRIAVSKTKSRVRVAVSDEGPGLPPDQRRLLETGDIDEYDDPTTGFGLNLVRLYVEEYGGTIETSVDGDGTTVTVGLPRARSTDENPGPNTLDLAGLEPAIPHLLVVVGTSLIAGVAYGLVSEALGGSVAGIGVFYGTVDPLVGWISHQFHSVVFGFAFVGLVSLVPEEWPDGYVTYVAVALGWAVALWAVAAGVVAPAWLQLDGRAVPIPNLTARLLVTHLAWGLALGVLTAAGYRHVLPGLYDRIDRVRLRSPG